MNVSNDQITLENVDDAGDTEHGSVEDKEDERMAEVFEIGCLGENAMQK